MASGLRPRMLRRVCDSRSKAWATGNMLISEMPARARSQVRPGKQYQVISALAEGGPMAKCLLSVVLGSCY